MIFSRWIILNKYSCSIIDSIIGAITTMHFLSGGSSNRSTTAIAYTVDYADLENNVFYPADSSVGTNFL